MVAACVAGAGLSITSVGRRLAGPTTLKHKIKRADRLIGNPHLYRERTAIYGALCRATLARIPEPLILIDWSDLKADQSFHLLRASIAVGGHCIDHLRGNSSPLASSATPRFRSAFSIPWRACCRLAQRPSSSPIRALRCPFFVPSRPLAGAGSDACEGATTSA